MFIGAEESAYSSFAPSPGSEPAVTPGGSCLMSMIRNPVAVDQRFVAERLTEGMPTDRGSYSDGTISVGAPKASGRESQAIVCSQLPEGLRSSSHEARLIESGFLTSN